MLVEIILQQRYIQISLQKNYNGGILKSCEKKKKKMFGPPRALLTTIPPKKLVSSHQETLRREPYSLSLSLSLSLEASME